MKKNPFEHIRHMQEIMNQMNFPAQMFQNQLSIVQSPGILAAIQFAEKMNPVISPAAIQAQKIEAFATMFSRNTQISVDAWSRFSNSQMYIPESIYPKLWDLISLIPDPETEHGENDLKGSIFVRNPSKQKEGKWTWDTLLFLIFTIFSTLYPVYESYQENKDREQEQIIQQKQREEDQQIKQEQHKEMMNKLNILITVVNQHITEEEEEPIDPGSDSLSPPENE